MFTGEYRHSVDDKGRIAIPSRFRARLDDGAFVARWIDTCLAVFPRDEWDRLAEKVAGLPLSDAGSRTFQRFVFAGETGERPQRRGEDDPALAVVVGSRDHAEIWAPAAWDEYRRDLESPEALAAALSGLGI